MESLLEFLSGCSSPDPFMGIFCGGAKFCASYVAIAKVGTGTINNRSLETLERLFESSREVVKIRKKDHFKWP